MQLGRPLVLVALALASACGGDDGGGGHDDAAVADAAVADTGPDGSGSDGPVTDGPRVDGPATDAAVDGRPLDAGVDAMVDASPTTDNHIHIQVSNTCAMTVTPTSITVPPNQTAYFDWHNHSTSYPVDVWMSYGGGFLDLPIGATWDEPIGHCSTPLVHDEYADISTACSSFRFIIHCQ